MKQFLAPFLLLSALVAAPPAAAQDPNVNAYQQAVDQARSAMMSDPELARRLADRAFALASNMPQTREGRVARATARWLQAEALISLNEFEAAGSLVAEALGTVAGETPGTKLHGDLLRSQGALAAIDGKPHEALRDFLEAHEIFRAAGERRSQAIILQDIGQIYMDAGDYARAMQYDDESVQVYPEDPSLNLTRHNNRGQVLREQGRHQEAEQAFLEALAVAQRINSPLLSVRILTNLAAVQNDLGKTAQAWTTINQARRLARSGDAEGWSPFVSGVSAAIAFRRGDLHQARNDVESAFVGMTLEETPLPFREIHDVAAKTYERLGDAQRALVHFRAFQRLDSEAKGLTASNSAQLLAARFDFENLRRGQLERDIEIERQNTRFRDTIFAGLTGAAGILSIILLVSFLSIRRSRNEVRATNATLTDTNSKLTKALAAKAEFLAMTSHEIRTPLNGILGMTQVLLRDRAVSDDIRSRVELINGAGETMRALVDDILDVSKMETGQTTLAEEEVDLKALLEEVAALWSASAQAKSLKLNLDFAAAPARIRSDGSRLRQIVSNLLSNAIKFTHDGRVGVRVAAEADPAGEILVIQVMDTGEGIADEHQKVIFEAFQQVDGSMSRQQSGTGLGLAICHRLAEAFGGTIGVESALGQGSTFTVRLPLVRAGDPAEQEQGTIAFTLGDATVLIIDPNPLNRSVLQMVFSSAAAKAKAAGSVGEALEALREEQVHHIVMDARAAIGAGQELVAAVRTASAEFKGHGAETTLLVSPEDAQEAPEILAIETAHTIFKPVSPAAVLEALTTFYLPQTGEASLAEREDVAA